LCGHGSMLLVLPSPLVLDVPKRLDVHGVIPLHHSV